MTALLPTAIVYRRGAVAHHHGDQVAPHRRVVTGAWPYPAPETCRDFSPGGLWIGPPEQEEQQVLACADAAWTAPDLTVPEI